MKTHQLAARVTLEVCKAVVGKVSTVRMVLANMLVGGHVLLEDVPGLGKTLLARSLASALGLSFRRIQFTPDLLPGDITGGYMLNRKSGEFELRPGPIFANIVLADEINRASPRTQSALLEAMQERQVTIEGHSLPLPEPFLVLATQNPIEYEGTFPLPEAQLDRFLVRLDIGYPDEDAEQEILKRRRTRQQDEVELVPVVTAEELAEVGKEIESVFIHDDLEKYIVRLVRKSRDHAGVHLGASPRAGLAFLKLTRAWAAMDDRNYVLPDDVKTFAEPVLNHRLVLQPDLWMQTNAGADIVESIVRGLPVPVLEGT